MKKSQVNVYLAKDINYFLAKFAAKHNTSKSEITENLIKDLRDRDNNAINKTKEKANQKDLLRFEMLIAELRTLLHRHLED